jgi:hypothetical protein
VKIVGVTLTSLGRSFFPDNLHGSARKPCWPGVAVSAMMARVKIGLAGGVVASDRCAWLPGPVRLVHESDAPPGAPVALGPAGADDEQVGRAVAELTRLVAAGGVVVAGAGIDLGSDFRSARLAGARGDQRDAVLAALRILGVDGADRLGDRTGFLVALFGPAVTRRVGASAAQAIGEGAWAALHLASAASDLLGPEQLERILALRTPEGVELTPEGAPSVLAQYLRQVLETMPGPRRLELILDLWAQVLDHRAGLARRERRLAAQSRRDRVADLRERRTHYDDEQILWRLKADIDAPSLADAARWAPPDHYWHNLFRHLVQDAVAATALLRTALAVSDHGLKEGLARSAALLRAAQAQLPDQIAARSARKVPGLTGLPARPGAYVRDISRKLASDRPRDAKFEGYIRPRLASARDFGIVTIESTGRLLSESMGVRDGILRDWAASGLQSWREGAGYSSVRPPNEWDGIAPWTVPLLGHGESLRQRLAASPTSPAPDVEAVGDLLWYAELVDALAQLYGHDTARPTPGTGGTWFDHDPPPSPAEPLTPRLDSITLAVSGAAQLVALGGAKPQPSRSWQGLTTGLLAGTAITEALTGEFAVPAQLIALDATVVTGTGTRLRVARNARTLAEWSAYMGNCIAGPYYLDSARAGRSVLVGLYDRDGLLHVNAELRPLRPTARGWRVEEIQARFNDAPDAVLAQRFRDWVAAVPGSAPTGAAPVPVDTEPPTRAVRRRARPRLIEEAAPALGTLTEQAWAAEVDESVIGAFAAVAETSPEAALTRLRRLTLERLADACRQALATGATDLDGLWTACGVRPLQTALQALDPDLRRRFDQLPLLLAEPPLPRALRALTKLPAIADAYALDLTGRRIRGAIGRLAASDDPVIAHPAAGRMGEPLLCALTVMITCQAPAIDLTPVMAPRAVAVPGYPVSTLSDEGGPWQRALPLARELGADTEAFWNEIAEHGLRVPASWLASGGWTSIWSRAHTHPTAAGQGRRRRVSTA